MSHLTHAAAESSGWIQKSSYNRLFKRINDMIIFRKRRWTGLFLFLAAVALGCAQSVTIDSELNDPRKPKWLGSKKGLDGGVLPPYTPVKVARQGDDITISMLGRHYAFGPTPFLSRVKSGGAEILVDSMRLKATVEDQPVTWQAGKVSTADHTQSKAIISQEFGTGDVVISMKTQVEYDGFARVDWSLKAKRRINLQRLVLEIPFAAENARYLYTWPTDFETEDERGHSGTLEKDFISKFKPIIWIGNEERGLSWYCESDQNWHLSNPKSAFEVLRSGDVVLLRLNLVTSPVTVTPDKPLDYTFAFQATPLKPIVRDGWDLRYGTAPEYGYDYDLLTKKTLHGKPVLQFLKEDEGIKTLIALNWTDIKCYPWPMGPGQEENFKRLVKLCHAYGIKVIPYLGYQMCHEAPEYPYMGDEVVRKPVTSNLDRYPNTKAKMTSIVCLRSIWQDGIVDGVARMMDEFDIDGVYLDSTIIPFDCTNSAHGCGYMRPDGTRAPTYPIFAVRDTYKRLYTVIKEKKPLGIIDSHVYDCMNASALAFSTSYWNGEQLSDKWKGAEGKPSEEEGLPLDRFRTEMMGVNWGVPADFLHYRLGDFTKSCAISLLHDVLVRPHAFWRAPTPAICALADKFGRKEARFLPYWNNSEYVKVTPQGAYASLYQHPKNGVLVIVSNLGQKASQVTLTLNLEKLGLTPQEITVSDGLTGEGLNRIRPGLGSGISDSGEIQLDLPSLGWKYIWIEP